jgi:hypothetical protein
VLHLYGDSVTIWRHATLDFALNEKSKSRLGYLPVSGVLIIAEQSGEGVLAGMSQECHPIPIFS